jgi:hypothetical protein
LSLDFLLFRSNTSCSFTAEISFSKLVETVRIGLLFLLEVFLLLQEPLPLDFYFPVLLHL